MDSTAGDLNRAAQDVGTAIEKQVSQEIDEKESAEKNLVGEKKDPDTASSGSSSEVDAGLQKLESKIIKVGEVKEGEEAYSHLPSRERDVIKRQLDIPSVKVTYRTLYRYATRNDLIIVAISALCAIAGGAVMPLMTVCSEV